MRSHQTNLSKAEGCFYSLAAVMALYGVAVFFYLVYLRVPYPYGIGLGEAPVFQAIESLRDGVWPYRDLSTPPFSLVPYGPVYLLATGFLKSIIGGAPFVVGRCVTAAATLGVSVLIFRILRQMQVSKLLAFLLGMMFLFHRHTQNWSVMVNVDMTGIFLDLLAFYFYMCFLRPGRVQIRWIVAGIFASLLAFYTKSSMVAAPAALFLTFLTQKRWKAAFVFSGILSAALVMVFIFLNHATAGQYWFHTTEISHRLFFSAFIGRFWLETFLTAPVLVAGAAVYLVYALLQQRTSIFFFYFLIAIGLTVSLGKQGSDTNYLLQFNALSLIAAGILIAEWNLVPLALITLQLALWVPANGNIFSVRDFFSQTRLAYDKISSVLRHTPHGPILSMDMSLLVANGREVFYEPFPMGQMSHSGLWDDRLITERLDRKEFSLAILYVYAPKLRADRNFTKNFMTAFNRNYQLKGYVSLPSPPDQPKRTFFFYEPKNIGGGIA